MNIRNHIPGIIIAILILIIGMRYTKQSPFSKSSKAPKNDHAVVYNDGDSGRAIIGGKIANPDRIIKQNKSAEKKYSRAMKYLQAHDYKNCVQLGKQVAKEAPKWPVGFNGLGMCQLLMGDLHGAEITYKKVLKLEPESPVALTGLGAVAAARGNHYQSIKYFREAADSLPADPETHFWLLKEYYKVGNYQLAAEEGRKFIALSRDEKKKAMARSILKKLKKKK